MSSFDKSFLVAVTLVGCALIVIGGVFNPNTLAGSVARFVFSFN